MGFLKALWRGDVTLVKTFWLYGVVGGGALISIPITLLETLGYIEPIDPVLWVGLFVYLVFCIAYIVITLVAIWRSSNNYQGSPWKALLAKGFVILGILSGISEFVR